MRLSVIIPIYNVEKYLKETLESIDLHDDMEVILVDDASPDNCGLICDEYAAKNSCFKVIHKSENEGLSMARNSGLDAATGDYVIFLDADDMYLEDNVFSTILYELGHNGFDLYFNNIKKWNADDNTVLELNSFDVEKVRGKSLQELLPYVSEQKSLPASACAKVIRRSILVESGIYFKKGIYSEDIEWFLRLISSNSIKHCGVIGVTYLYRQGNAGSITSNVGEKNIDDLLTTIEQACNDECHIESQYRQDYRKCLAFELMILIYFLNYAKKRKREFRARIKILLPVMKSSHDKRVKMTFLSVKILGFALTEKLLKIMRKNR